MAGTGPRRLALVSLLLCCGLLPCSTGCTSVGTYFRSRVADLQDALPASVAVGFGVGVSARVTPFVNVGLGITPIENIRAGYDDRVVHGVWREVNVLFPYTLWDDLLEDDPLAPHETGFPAWTAPIVYRWQIFRDAPWTERADSWAEPSVRSWGRHPPVVRESLGAFGLPAARRWLDFNDLRRQQGDEDVIDTLGSPERATLWETRRAGRPAQRAWDLVEVDAFLLFVGVRVGVRPVEFVDFMLGWFLIDVLGDDLPEPVSNEPVSLPLPPDS